MKQSYNEWKRGLLSSIVIVLNVITYFVNVLWVGGVMTVNYWTMNGSSSSQCFKYSQFYTTVMLELE
jgi:hypothetical protein